MKFVKTSRQALVEANYGIETLSAQRNRDFYLNFPAPVSFTIPAETKTISANELQLLAIWFCRGTAIKHRNTSTTTKTSIQEWKYEMVDSLPSVYLKYGKDTPQKAYDFGKKLIDACNQRSRIPFATLEDAYKRIMRAFWSYNINIQSPNEKTFLEVRAEMQAMQDIKDLTYVSDSAMETVDKYSEELLAHYIRVFNISIPDWSIKNNYVRTRHGYAQMPQVDMNSQYQMFYQKAGEHGYAGLDEDITPVPYTLQKDGIPVQLHNEGLRAQITEQVDWYITMFNETKDTMLLGEGWAHCEECGFYSINQGCQCGTHAPLKTQELETIAQAYQGFYNNSIEDEVLG